MGCECALELYLREHPPIEANFNYAKGHLVQVREDLVKLIRVRFGMWCDSLIRL